ncbi:hypothetical protein RSAG8_08172, partial [Rhizoctonia solani AG-8 WAC10335]
MHTTNRTSNALVKSVRSDLIPQDTYSRPCLAPVGNAQTQALADATETLPHIADLTPPVTSSISSASSNQLSDLRPVSLTAEETEATKQLPRLPAFNRSTVRALTICSEEPASTNRLLESPAGKPPTVLATPTCSEASEPQTIGSQAPTISLSLLDDPNWLTDVFASLDRLPSMALQAVEDELQPTEPPVRLNSTKILGTSPKALEPPVHSILQGKGKTGRAAQAGAKTSVIWWWTLNHQSCCKGADHWWKPPNRSQIDGSG